MKLKVRKLKIPHVSVHVSAHTRLQIALGLALGFTLIVTIIGTTVYNLSGAYKLDLSRPGFERQRQEVSQSQQPRIYDTTGPVTSDFLDEFLSEFDARVQQDINQYGDFRDLVLEDENMLGF